MLVVVFVAVACALDADCRELALETIPDLGSPSREGAVPAARPGTKPAPPPDPAQVPRPTPLPVPPVIEPPTGTPEDDCLDGDNPAEVERILQEAASRTGYFGLGRASSRTANIIGQRWVGPGYRISRSGVAWLAADELRRYRPPAFKHRLGKVQANVEWGLVPRKYISNGHIDIDERCP